MPHSNRLTPSEGGDIIESNIRSELERLVGAVREFLRKKKGAPISTLRTAVCRAEEFLRQAQRSE